MTLYEQVFPEQAEDARLWKTRLGVPEELTSERLSSGQIARYLGFQMPELSDVARSVEDSKWLSYQNGNFLVEIRDNDSFERKLKTHESMVWMSDLDDVLMDTTTWHQREHEIILEFLQSNCINADIKQVKAIYELSKIYVPGVADVQTRYTPHLNLILIYQFIRRQKDDHMTPAEALNRLVIDQCDIQDRVKQIGENVLSDYQYNELILKRLLANNPPAECLHIPLIRDLFGRDKITEDKISEGKTNEDHLGDDTTMRIIITRGKIEGPLGQVYKVHGSGIMTLPSVDAVVYTNDVKVRALFSLDILIPMLKDRMVFLYDDNPSEINPFYEQLAQGSKRTKFNIELIHTRHSTAKRRDKKIMVPLDGTIVEQPPLAGTGYTYMKDGSREVDSFDNAPPGQETTFFDHHAPGGTGVIVVI